MPSSSSPDTAKEASTPAPSSPPPADTESSQAKPKTRLLKDVEAEENRTIYEALYKSLDTEEEQAVQEELTTSDTLRLAREAKAQFLKALNDPVSEKAKACGTLMRQLSTKENERVARIFVGVTAAMFTLPIVMLFVGMRVIAPRYGYDDVLCGGFLAVGTTVLIMVSYAIYGLFFEKPPPSAAPLPATTTEAPETKKTK